MRTWLAAAIIVAGLVGSGLAVAQSGARPLDDSQPPELVPDDGRAVLRRRMSRHGAMLDALTSATLEVDRTKVIELATRLERDTGLGAWPGPDAGVSRKALEEVESELRRRARALADLARRGTDDQLAAGVRSLMETCLTCHQRAFGEGKAQKAAPR